MELRVIKVKSDAYWKDQLLGYLASYADHVGANYSKGLFRSMDEVFSFLENRLADYLQDHPRYVKPASLFITYSKPSCCPAMISITYLDQSIELKEHKNSTSVKKETAMNLGQN